MVKTKKLELTPTCHFEEIYYESAGHTDVTLKYVEHSQEFWRSGNITSVAIDANMARKIIMFLMAEHECQVRDKAIEWRPIETAPKDGTAIDIWAGMRYADARYHDGAWEFDSPTSGYMETVLEPPTHWMPLPDAPNV